MAELAALLNDPDRSIIGNPRAGTYAVSLVADALDDASRIATQLQSLGLEPKTNGRRDRSGTTRSAFVTLYSAGDQTRLLEAVGSTLDPERRQRLEDLVLARGPIPDNIRQHIRKLYRSDGLSAQAIASRMNDAGIIAGMGGIRWTARKVKAAMADA